MVHHPSPTFTPSERVALRYIHDHEDEIPSLDVRTLAKRAGTSTATIVRLSQKLGFSGFAEYRYAILHTRRGRHDTAKRASVPAVPATEELVTTARLLVAEDVEQAADALATAETIILVGSGLSHIVVEYLHHYLFSASRPTVCPPNQESALDAIRGSSASSVVVCISLSGTSGTLDLAREAHNRGMFVIGITCSLTSGLITMCDIHLLAIATRQTAGHGTDTETDSRLGLLVVADVLARTYAHRHPQGNTVEEALPA